MYNISYIDDNIYSDFINDESNLNTSSIDNLPFSSTPSNTVNHIKVLNASNFTVNFNILYTLGEKNFTLHSRNFLPNFTRQISFPSNASFIYLFINSINSLNQEIPIYHKSLSLNKNFNFTINGFIDNPIIVKN